MKFDDSVIDSLLYSEESNDLDFKSESYKFTSATDIEKSELLKDIIAFANSWRRTDAFILIGVKEVMGSRSEVVGIVETLDDAKIQQFINSKTNTPITFSYQNIHYENKNIGIIHIPCQKRPFYLKKDYGKLKRETIYIRRGSSTDIAKLDEIAQMGNSILSPDIKNSPELELFFADIEKLIILSDQYESSSLILKAPKHSDIPDYTLKRPTNQLFGGSFQFETANHSYYRELASFIKEYCYFTPLYLAVRNSGDCVARDVRVELKVEDVNSTISILESKNIKKSPERSYSTLNLKHSINPNIFSEPKQYLKSKKIEKHWLIEAGVHKVQAKSISWLELPFYIAANKAQVINIEATIYSDDLSEPSKKELVVANKISERSVTLKEIETIDHERWKTTPEYAEFKQMHKEMRENNT